MLVSLKMKNSGFVKTCDEYVHHANARQVSIGQGKQCHDDYIGNVMIKKWHSFGIMSDAVRNVAKHEERDKSWNGKKNHDIGEDLKKIYKEMQTD